MKSGLIYKITNKTNGKCYIGQTTTSTKRRWSQHIYNANTKASKCRYLENAIRKHGKENFIIEAIYICKVDELNSAEIHLINKYKSNNTQFGYNICDGGGGSIGRVVTDEHRKKISNANRKCDIDLINIQERRINNVLVGYVVSKTINNIRHSKNFANTKQTLSENLELAKKWLNDLDNGTTVDTNRYNRKFKLPRNISYNYTNQKEIQGYNVKIERNGKRYIKSFTSKHISMDEKLKLAIKYKEQISSSLRKNEEECPGNRDMIIRSQALKVC